MNPSPLLISQKHTLPDSVVPMAMPSSLPLVPGSKLRLMCSYGGHITHHDNNSLFYNGGDTRIVAVDRHISLKNLCSHLSRSLLHETKPFTLKYHLPNEDLDNLITVSTDEDLQNMIDEYDRLASNPSPSPSRLRMFLFFCKPVTAVSMDTLHVDDHDMWFVEALNNSGILSRVVSDSVAVDNCLLNLHDDDDADDVSAAAGFSLPSPDSLASESSIESANSHSKPTTVVYYQDLCQAEQHVDNEGTTLPNNIKSEASNQNQQHQFDYVHCPIGTGQVPISSYYPIYTPQSHQHLHQYPVYVMPIGLGSTPPHNMALQSNITYPKVTPSVYKASNIANFIQVPQPIPITPSAMTNYCYEYGGSMQDQVYYTQQQHATAPPQYHSMTPLSDVSKQFAIDNIQQQNKTS